MSEPIWCNVTVHFPAHWVVDGEPPWFMKRLGEALLNGELDDFQHPNAATWYANGEGNYGLYDSDVEEVLDLLVKHRIPYVATSDAKYEMTGEVYVYDGDAEVLWHGEYSESGAVLNSYTYARIKAGESDFESVERYFEILNTNAGDLPIKHLEDLPIPEEGDDE